ncbi:MAG TPA: amidohydrolase family protein [Candidatus Baltobacteraceae bacterium]|nr:amidohydrolase family protein [Candidatus Baltobacteraceae bacterium]
MIVRAGVLYDGTMDAPRRNADIVIEDGRIREIRDASGECDRQAACVTPGMVNAHVHLEMSGQPDPLLIVNQYNTVQRTLHAVDNAARTLRAGVTTVRDVGANDAIAIEIRDAIEQGRIPGPRMRAAGKVLCMTGGHGWPIGRAVDNPWEARKGAREQRLAGADCLKLIATGGVLTKGAVPGVAQLTIEEMSAACDEAHRHDMRVAAHAIGTEGIKNALRSGVDSIEHGHMLDDEAIALFKERGAYLVPTLTAPTCILEHAEGGGQPDYVVRKAREINEHMLRNIRRAFDAGVKIAGGSDAGTPFNFHEKYADEVVLMHKLLGMSPQQALHAATAVAAELIGLHRGILEPGAHADLLLLDTDVERDLHALTRPVAVIKGGVYTGTA